METFYGRMNPEWKTIISMDEVEKIRTELGRG